MKRAARVDANHAAIVSALRKVGCQVLDLSQLGNGCPDLLVRVGRFQCVSGGRSEMKAVLMEVKTTRGTLTAEQKAFQVYWPEVLTVRSVSDALRAIGVAC